MNRQEEMSIGFQKVAERLRDLRPPTKEEVLRDRLLLVLAQPTKSKLLEVCCSLYFLEDDGTSLSQKTQNLLDQAIFLLKGVLL